VRFFVSVKDETLRAAAWKTGKIKIKSLINSHQFIQHKNKTAALMSTVLFVLNDAYLLFAFAVFEVVFVPSRVDC